VPELRAFVEIDAMQPQWAAYVAQTCQGDPPYAGMAQLYVEVAPANAVFALVDAAVKNADVRAGLQVVERQYGTLELHGRDPASVRTAADVILERLGRERADATAPEIVASETITRVDANQAQLVNRLRSASLLLENETMYLLELSPAAYVAVAANEAEKHAPVKLVYAAVLGASGRMIVSGRDDEVAEARTAALAAVRAG
jgi:ethanolamine utilization microcompartment shell protein EutL